MKGVTLYSARNFDAVLNHYMAEEREDPAILRSHEKGRELEKGNEVYSPVTRRKRELSEGIHEIRGYWLG